MHRIVSLRPPRATLVACLLAPLVISRPARGEEGFTFGSYGRVGVGSDLRGGTPSPVNVVAHGARVVEPSYVELDVYYRRDLAERFRVRSVMTLAALGDLFHYTGEFDARLALRNLFAEVTRDGSLSIWVGSRMLRGDDIYLLDWWPLDESNTVGGGWTWRGGPFAFGGHVGLSRSIDPRQFGVERVPAPTTGAAEVVTLDRQRWIASLHGTMFGGGSDSRPIGWKVKLYLEAQALAAGQREREDGSIESLPADYGWTAGTQLGVFGRGNHANLFVRFSQGIAAYPDLAPPWGFDREGRTFPEANELLLGCSANAEVARGGVMFGGYARRFESAARGEDPTDGWEWIANARGWVTVHAPFQAALDVSWQQRFAGAMSPTALDALDAAVFQVAPMFMITPTGGSYARPQIRLVYRLAHLNEGALDLYPLDDPRRDHPWVHYLGVQAEWWANSSYL